MVPMQFRTWIFMIVINLRSIISISERHNFFSSRAEWCTNNISHSKPHYHTTHPFKNRSFSSSSFLLSPPLSYAAILDFKFQLVFFNIFKEKMLKLERKTLFKGAIVIWIGPMAILGREIVVHSKYMEKWDLHPGIRAGINGWIISKKKHQSEGYSKPASRLLEAGQGIRYGEGQGMKSPGP